jgi:hypothetical protein
MGANEEQIYYLNAEIIDPYSYSLIHVAISFLIFLGVNLLIDLYWRSGKNDGEPKYEKYDKLNNPNIPLPLNNSMSQTGRTVLNTNQDSPTSSNNYEFNSLLVHNNQFDDDDDDNEK